jgi:SAM-dependent methyltransferase
MSISESTSLVTDGVINCPICNTQCVNSVHFYLGNFVYRCKKCGLDFADSIINTQEGSGELVSTNTPELILSNYYNNFEFDVDVAHKSLSLRFPILEKARGQRINSVCEIGCGPGTAYKFFAEKGVDWVGIDADSRSILHGQKNNIPIVNCEIDDLGKKFDLIYFHQVLEHIWEPVEFMESIYEQLNDGGIVAIGIPNHAGFTALFRRFFHNFFKSSFGMLQFPHHLRAYSPKTIDYLLRLTNFEPQMIKAVRSTELLWGEWYHVKGHLPAKAIFGIGAMLGFGTLLYAYGKKVNLCNEK